MAWFQTTTDNFTKANQSGLGNNWIVSTTNWAIVSNQAVSQQVSNPWFSNNALRPIAENSLNSRIVAVVPIQTISATPSTAFYSIHRFTAGGGGYLIGLDSVNGIQIFTSIGTSVAQIGTGQAITGGYTSSHAYTIDSNVTGTNPSTLSVTITDTTTSTVVGTRSVTDSGAAFQVAGQTGIFVALPAAGTAAYAGFTNYTDVAPTTATSYTLTGSSTGAVAQPGTYTVSLNGTVASTVTITPSDSSGGGTFNPTSLAFTSGGTSTQTFTYTPASSGTKTLSSTNSGTLTNPASTNVVVSILTLVTSPAFMFSPGNWKGDTGRGGTQYRRSWNNGAYFAFVFTASASPTAVIQIPTTSTTNILGIYINGTYTDEVAATGNVTLSGLIPSAVNTIRVVLKRSNQASRWNSGVNAVQINGIVIDNASTVGVAPVNSQWALIVGDSITEGILANNGSDSNLQDYSFALGRYLETQGIDYCVSACGGSGWLRQGDIPADVPGYYIISGSTSGSGGTYNDASSRWNKVDQGVSLLSSDNLMSSYGATGTPPSLIYINYMTNDVLNAVNLSDVQASITQSLVALRASAPNAVIVIQIPFGMYGSSTRSYDQNYMAALKNGTAAANVGAVLADFGPNISRAITTLFYTNADYVHLNVVGHQFISPLVIGTVTAAITPTINQIAQAVWSRSQRTVTG